MSLIAGTGESSEARHKAGHPRGSWKPHTQIPSHACPAALTQSALLKKTPPRHYSTTRRTSRTMGPKSKKGASNDRQRSAEEEVEDPLQAVVSFFVRTIHHCVILSSP